MKYHLPDREECLTLTKETDAFYVSETVVEGYKVEMYDYRLASYDDFFPDGEDWSELRGLTFIYDPERKEWDRFLALNKFFNVNQTIGSMYEDVAKETIIKVQDKLDGSMIMFVKFPNGAIRAKSKMSFISPQANIAQEILNKNKDLRTLVGSSLSSGDTCIFELTSPKNQIVLDYQNTELTLLQIRDIDGKYVDSNLIAEAFNVKSAKEFNLTLDEMMKLREMTEAHLLDKLNDKKFNYFKDFKDYIFSNCTA